MTVNATDDSYDKARQSMAQAEEEMRRRGAIVIKNGGRFQSKKVTVRAPAPALAKLAKPKHSSHSPLSNIKLGMSKPKKGPFPSTRCRQSGADVLEKPLRERVTHLLALRPYKRPELILRLQRDGLAEADKDVLDSVLMEVGQLSARDSTFLLKDGLYKELRKDWPGYSSGDQQLLKRILVRRLFEPQPNLLTVPEAQVSPLRDTPNSSPAHRPKLCAPEEYTDPLASKKPRISHLSGKSGSKKSRFRPSEQSDHKDADVGADPGRWGSLDASKLLDSLSAVCQQDAELVKRLNPTDAAQEGPKDPEDPTPNCDPHPSPPRAPSLNRRTAKRKKSKHKRRDLEEDGWRDRKERRKEHGSKDPDSKDSLDGRETGEMLFDSTVAEEDNDAADYLLTYSTICSQHQRQSYKQDFNKEYNEYRDLHARIDGMTRQFMELDAQLKQLHHDSHKYKTVHNKILQEYRKIKKSNPNYNKDKIRCEYLHKKLAHIKKLISQFDQQQLGVDRSCPK
ncbi:RNA polymerase II elongation factor ELL-like isoform X2 [Cololabis saira]|nr:RNA polymerase II elongation factor ELL-like isoform X2 [Cololabis saira]